MEVTADQLAGIVDQFGAMTRAELAEGLAELAFKQGEEYDTDAFDAQIDDAEASYHLISLDPERAGLDQSLDEEVFVPGPVAFPELPQDGQDLLHILDIDGRFPDREAAGTVAAQRFLSEAAAAVDAGETEKIGMLVDVSYELEAWASVDLSETRTRLDESR
jgi:hypothetical protein